MLKNHLKREKLRTLQRNLNRPPPAKKAMVRIHNGKTGQVIEKEILFPNFISGSHHHFTVDIQPHEFLNFDFFYM